MQEISGFAVVATRFGGPEVQQVRPISIKAPGLGQVRVRVLAASDGSTDVLARRCGYLLHPFAPLVPGYDFVGEIIDWHRSVAGALRSAGLGVGSRVAAVVPEMGAHVTHRLVSAKALVSVPDALDSIIAAAIPLDYLTAASALERHARLGSAQSGGQKSILIQGASGPVGRAIAQLAAREKLIMYGTASQRNRTTVEEAGIRFVDYASKDLLETVRDKEPGGLDAIFDHRGGPELRQMRSLLKPGGVAVSYAFGGRPGYEKRDTALGSVEALAGSLPIGRTRSALCSMPFEIRLDRRAYQDRLRRLFDQVVAGEIGPADTRTYAFDKVVEAHRDVEERSTQGKVVLSMVPA